MWQSFRFVHFLCRESIKFFFSINSSRSVCFTANEICNFFRDACRIALMTDCNKSSLLCDMYPIMHPFIYEDRMKLTKVPRSWQDEDENRNEKLIMLLSSSNHRNDEFIENIAAGTHQKEWNFCVGRAFIVLSSVFVITRRCFHQRFVIKRKTLGKWNEKRFWVFIQQPAFVVIG